MPSPSDSSLRSRNLQATRTSPVSRRPPRWSICICALAACSTSIRNSMRSCEIALCNNKTKFAWTLSSPLGGCSGSFRVSGSIAVWSVCWKLVTVIFTHYIEVYLNEVKSELNAVLADAVACEECKAILTVEIENIMRCWAQLPVRISLSKVWYIRLRSLIWSVVDFHLTSQKRAFRFSLVVLLSRVHLYTLILGCPFEGRFWFFVYCVSKSFRKSIT